MRNMDDGLTSILDPNWSVIPSVFTESIGALGMMRVDAYETDTDFHIQCECPGIPKENITCTIENHVLTIKGEKQIW